MTIDPVGNNDNVYYPNHNLDTSNPTTWLYGSYGSPSVYAVNQGAVGDCWFLSSLMCMAKFDPNYLKSMITADGNGYYTVRLYNSNGALTPVTIGDDLPNGANNSNNVVGNWASLIEKAYAALQGSDGYDAMNNGYVSTAFTALTGLSASWNSIIANQSSSYYASISSQIITDLEQNDGVVLNSYYLFVPQSDPLNGCLPGTFPGVDYNASAGSYEGVALGLLSDDSTSSTKRTVTPSSVMTTRRAASSSAILGAAPVRPNTAATA